MEEKGKGISSFDAEVGVIGSILIEPGSYRRVSEAVTAECFQSDICRQVFQAAAALDVAGEPIDPMTIKERLNDSVPDKTLAQIMNLTPTAANDTLYAKLVADHAKRRKLQDMAQDILDNPDMDANALIAQTNAALESLTNEITDGICISSPDMVNAFYASLEQRENGKRNVIPTGYKNLDKALGGGFLRGGLYVIAARPGMGKTTFGLNIADNMQEPALFISLEMSGNQITARRIARISDIPSNRILMGDDLTEDEYRRIGTASNALYGSKVFMNRRMVAKVSEIGTMARCIKDLSLVVVDYIGLVKPEREGANRYEMVTEISGALKRLAMSLDVPILALAQLNREAESRKDKKPKLSDLRDSGAIEQDADGVLLLYRQDYYDEEEEKDTGCPSLVECNIAKNRHGETGLVRFNGYLDISRFAEI